MKATAIHHYFTALAVLLLVACGRNIVWEKPSLTQDQFNKDNYECQSENTYYSQGYRPSPVTGQPTSPGSGFARGFNNTFFIPAGPRVNTAGYKSCMYARGYHEQGDRSQAPGIRVDNAYSGQAVAQAQDIEHPDEAGNCSVGYFAYEGACISSKALEEKGPDVIAQQLLKFLTRNQTPKRDAAPAICESKIDDDNGDILELANSAIVKISRGYLGYVGYRNEVLLFKTGNDWKLWIEGKKVFDVDLLREPMSCRSPSVYPIEAATNDEVFIINGEQYEAKTFCLGWERGETVVFLEGSALGVCVSASLFNVNRLATCNVWCE